VGPQNPEIFTLVRLPDHPEGDWGCYATIEKKERYLSTRHFQGHHNVPFDTGDYEGVRVAGDDTNHSISCDDSPLKCSFH